MNNFTFNKQFDFPVRKVSIMKVYLLGLSALAVIAAVAFVSSVSIARAATPVITQVVVPDTDVADVLHPGEYIDVYMVASPETDTLSVAVGGTCTVNNVDVSNTFNDNTDGSYRITYTVGETDTPRGPGQVPISCMLQDPSGAKVTVSAFTDGNTVSVVTGNDNGTTTVNKTSLRNAITAALNLHDSSVAGTEPGQYPQSALDAYQTAINAANAVWNDANATQADVDAALANLNTATTNFNAAKVPPAGNNVDFTTVSIEPDHAIRTTGYEFRINLQAPAAENDLTVSGTCTVNTKNVASSLVNDTDGAYHLMYTVGATDPDAAAGEIPISCTLHSPTTGDTLVASHLTDNNTAGVDADLITAVTATANGPASETITFTTAVPTVGSVEYTTNNLTLSTDAETNMSTSHSITINNLNHSTQYSYEVIVTGDNNLEGTTPNLNFTTEGNGGDTTPNQTALNAAIGNAQTILAAANEGTSPGQYAVGSKAILQLAIDAAAAVKNNSSATQAQVDAAVTALNSAVTTFQAGIVPETTDNGTLAVTSIIPVKTSARANGNFDDGWKWTFNVTVPTSETSLQVKFGNWTQNGGTHSIATAGNMRVSSPQATPNDTVTITDADTYGSPLNITGDLDPNTPGRQIQIIVEARIPSGTFNGSYSTTYGITTVQP